MQDPVKRRSRLLLVEDEIDVCEMYATFLRARGFEVIIASDGEEAVIRALNGSFDLMILDLGLPKVDGLEVLRRLRSYASTKGLPVVVLSARVGVEVRAAAVAAGADIALEKPCHLEDLEAAVRVFLVRGKRIRDRDSSP